MQIDNSMLNYERKIYRGKFLVILPVRIVKRLSTAKNKAFVSVIPQKRSTILISIIERLVRVESVIWTHKLRSYNNSLHMIDIKQFITNIDSLVILLVQTRKKLNRSITV